MRKVTGTKRAGPSKSSQRTVRKASAKRPTRMTGAPGTTGAKSKRSRAVKDAAKTLDRRHKLRRTVR